MWRSATITAYDVMETVHVTATVRTNDGLSIGTSSRVLEISVQVKSVGEETDARWLRDALVALAESL